MATTVYLVYHWQLAEADPHCLHYVSTEKEWELVHWLARTAGPHGPARVQSFDGALEATRYLGRRAVEHLRARWSRDTGLQYPAVPVAVDSIRDIPWAALRGTSPIFAIDQLPRDLERDQLRNAASVRDPQPEMDLFPAAMPETTLKLLYRAILVNHTRWELNEEQRSAR